MCMQQCVALTGSYLMEILVEIIDYEMTSTHHHEGKEQVL